ncbi:MAG: hypothetical protein ACXAD7_18015 [Candidatus Kariarchaeaceae archaeon]|jgi:hypothetical protein
MGSSENDLEKLEKKLKNMQELVELQFEMGEDPSKNLVKINELENLIKSMK